MAYKDDLDKPVLAITAWIRSRESVSVIFGSKENCRETNRAGLDRLSHGIEKSFDSRFGPPRCRFGLNISNQRVSLAMILLNSFMSLLSSEELYSRPFYTLNVRRKAASMCSALSGESGNEAPLSS